MSELKVTTLKHADSAVDSIVMASSGAVAFGAAVTDSAGVAVKGGVPAQAWVNFNGQGTVAIRRAFNVASITDNGTGNYTVNFTTAMVDVNYAAVGCAGGTNNNIGDRQLSTYPLTTTTCKAISGQTAVGTVYDATQMHVSIFS